LKIEIVGPVMISLKYIKLFEAFDSSNSGVISYIKNKDKFIKLVCTIDFHTQNYQMIWIPSFQKALNKKAIDQNIGEISLIKFWFDVNGTLKMTGVDGIKRGS
jgi:hypothetical protein